MKTIIIGTSNKEIVKECTIREAIQNGMQYVEMENEVLIGTDILIRIQEPIELVDINNFSIGRFISDLSNHEECIERYIPVSLNHQECIESQKNVNNKYSRNLKNDSIQTKRKIKTRTYYDKRRKY